VAGDEGRTYQNRVTANWFAIFLSFLLFLGTSLLLKAVLEGSYPPSEDAAWGKAVGGLGFFALVGIYLIVTFLKEAYYDAPSKVTLDKDTIIFEFKRKPPLFLEWKSVIQVIASVKERTIVPANPKVSGQISYSKNPNRPSRYNFRHFMVSYDIANSMISRYKGDPIPTETVLDSVVQTLTLEAEQRPTDNLAYGLLFGLVSTMLLIGFILVYYIGSLRYEYVFGGCSIVAAVVAISYYRRGFHSLKETVIEPDIAKVNISIWERIAGRKSVLRIEDIDTIRILREGTLKLETHEMVEPTYYAMIVTKDGKMYSIGPRNRATVERAAAFMKGVLGKPIVI
jgi:hypothetical protein